MQILVVILSGFLALFLLLGLIFVIALIKLTRAVGRLVEKAEGAVTNVEVATTMLKNTAGPFAVAKVLLNIADLFRGDSNKKGRK